MAADIPVIKIGCCINMTSKTASGIGEENIPLFARLGYDYLELPLAQLMDLSDNEFKAVKKTAADCGISVEACNNFFPASHRLTGANADHKRALEYARAALSRAAELGAEVVVLGSSGAKNIPEGFPTEEAEKQFIDLLGNINVIAAPLGIDIVIEPLNKTESNFVNSVAEGLVIARAVNKSNIRLLADYYHMRMEDEPMSDIVEAGDMMRHTHIAAKEGRLFPAAGDGEDYAAFAGALRSIGYSGRVSIEGYTTGSLETAAAEGFALMRKVLNP